MCAPIYLYCIELYFSVSALNCLHNVIFNLRAVLSSFYSTGNQCRLILKNVEILEIPAEYVEFETMLKALRKLNFMVSQEILPSDFSHVISHFANSWYILSDKFHLSTSPKCHIILDHLEEYFTETGLSLVKTADQLIENMHQYFYKVMARSNYYVKHPTNPRHGKYLLRFVKHVNSQNICITNDKYIE